MQAVHGAVVFAHYWITGYEQTPEVSVIPGPQVKHADAVQVRQPW